VYIVVLNEKGAQGEPLKIEPPPQALTGTPPVAPVPRSVAAPPVPRQTAPQLPALK
jgi:hypothetical protein